MALDQPVSGRHDKEYAPDENQHRRRDAERNHVGKRIQFASEIAGGVGHARNATVQTVKQDGERQSLGGNGEMDVRGEISGLGQQRTFKGLQNSDETQKDIRAGKKRGQGVSSPAGTFSGNRRTDKTLSNTQTVAPFAARRARMVRPPETLSPILASSFQSGPNRTSTREPNLM